MERLALERKPLGAVDVDLCQDCQAIWFDAHESLQLTPAAVLALFRAMQAAVARERHPLPERLACPRCETPLARTQDLQRTTRFTYWRCPRGHGRLTPFAQFLREKDFIRPLDDAELARLKSAVRVIRCASCGAPVDLERSTACGYCRSPIVALDPDAVVRRQDELSAAASRKAPDAGALMDAMIALDRERRMADVLGGQAPVVDLLELGAGALVRLLDR
jgi:hypothetical protein